MIADNLTNEICRKGNKIYPLKEVMIRKVKCLKRPKIDAIKLKEMYTQDKKGAEKGVDAEGEDS